MLHCYDGWPRPFACRNVKQHSPFSIVCYIWCNNNISLIANFPITHTHTQIRAHIYIYKYICKLTAKTQWGYIWRLRWRCVACSNRHLHFFLSCHTLFKRYPHLFHVHTMSLKQTKNYARRFRPVFCTQVDRCQNEHSLDWANVKCHKPLYRKNTFLKICRNDADSRVQNNPSLLYNTSFSPRSAATSARIGFLIHNSSFPRKSRGYIIYTLHFKREYSRLLQNQKRWISHYPLCSCGAAWIKRKQFLSEAWLAILQYVQQHPHNYIFFYQCIASRYRSSNYSHIYLFVR